MKCDKLKSIWTAKATTMQKWMAKTQSRDNMHIERNLLQSIHLIKCY